VRAVAASLALDTKRVQFTPDLMPGDITGSVVYNAGKFDFREGPVFTNLLLADEINRTRPRRRRRCSRR
jgi:MoxR-like ATPase